MGNKQGTNKGQNSPVGTMVGQYMPSTKQEWNMVGGTTLTFLGLALAGGTVIGIGAGIARMRSERAFVQQANKLGYSRVTNNRAMTGDLASLLEHVDGIASAARLYHNAKGKEAKNVEEFKVCSEANKQLESEMALVRKVLPAHANFVMVLSDVAKLFREVYVEKKTQKKEELASLIRETGLDRKGLSEGDPETLSRMADLFGTSERQILLAFQVVMRHLQDTTPEELRRYPSVMARNFSERCSHFSDMLQCISRDMTRDIQDVLVRTRSYRLQ